MNKCLGEVQYNNNNNNDSIYRSRGKDSWITKKNSCDHLLLINFQINHELHCILLDKEDANFLHADILGKKRTRVNLS